MACGSKIAFDAGSGERLDRTKGAARRDLRAESAQEDGRAFGGKFRVVFHPDALEVLNRPASLVDFGGERIAYQAEAVLLESLEKSALNGLACRRDKDVRSGCTRT